MTAFMPYFNPRSHERSDKKAKHKKLEKWERTFYNENKDIIDLKRRKNKRSQAEKDALDALIG